MGKHTPGPWQAIGTDPDEGGDWFWVKGQPSPVLRGFTKEIGAVNGPQNDPEQQANADLIAAAPRLLIELKSCLAALREYENIHHPAGSDGAQRASLAMSMARAAIAKATGETP